MTFKFRPEREALHNVKAMWLLGRLSRNYETIADFREGNGEAICKVCASLIDLCRKIDLPTTARVKRRSSIRSVPSRYTLARLIF